MGHVKIIQSDDADNWNRILHKAYQFDFYHTLEYHLIAEKRGKGKPILFFYEDDSYCIALPLLLRLIDSEDLSLPGYKDLFDVTSVYGYGGPIFSHKKLPAEFVKIFSTSLIDILREMHVVSLFSRLHPLIQIDPSFNNYFPHKVIGQTVSIDLTIPTEDQRARYRTDHRQGIKRLKKAGFYCAEDTELTFLDEFVRIYHETMSRVHAAPTYYFDKSYFERLLMHMNEMMHLFVCMQNEEVACAGVFSLCNGIVQYHLSGTSSTFKKHAPMKLLIDFVSAWSKENNALTFHLGGGVGSKEDSLLYFKSGFSNQRHVYAVWEKIVLPETYALLCNKKNACSNIHNSTNYSGYYFPMYRSVDSSVNSIAKENIERVN
jgi:hypothetical protein